MARNPVCVSNTLFMSDNLSPVIAPNASAPSATESSTGPEGSQDGQQAPAASGAAASASAHDHATEIANPSLSVLPCEKMSLGRKPLRPIRYRAHPTIPDIHTTHLAESYFPRLCGPCGHTAHTHKTRHGWRVTSKGRERAHERLPLTARQRHSQLSQ